MMIYKSVIRSQLSYGLLVLMFSLRHTNNIIDKLHPRTLIFVLMSVMKTILTHTDQCSNLCPLKTLENQRFSDVFRGYKMGA